MKSLISTLLVLCTCSVSAQLTPAQPAFHMNGAVYLSSGESIATNGISYVGNDSIHVFYKKKDSYRTVAIQDIKKIHSSNQGFLKGAVLGGLTGFGLGYLAGILSYKDDFSISNDDNKDHQKVRGTIGGLIGVLPMAIIGGMTGAVAIRKNFRIDGDRKKLYKVTTPAF